MSEYFDDEPADIGGDSIAVAPGEVANEGGCRFLVILVDVMDEV